MFKLLTLIELSSNLSMTWLYSGCIPLSKQTVLIWRTCRKASWLPSEFNQPINHMMSLRGNICNFDNDLCSNIIQLNMF